MNSIRAEVRNFVDTTHNAILNEAVAIGISLSTALQDISSRVSSWGFVMEQTWIRLSSWSTNPESSPACSAPMMQCKFCNPGPFVGICSAQNSTVGYFDATPKRTDATPRLDAVMPVVDEVEATLSDIHNTVYALRSDLVAKLGPARTGGSFKHRYEHDGVKLRLYEAKLWLSESRSKLSKAQSMIANAAAYRDPLPIRHPRVLLEIRKIKSNHVESLNSLVGTEFQFANLLNKCIDALASLAQCVYTTDDIDSDREHQCIKSPPVENSDAGGIWESCTQVGRTACSVFFEGCSRLSQWASCMVSKLRAMCIQFESSMSKSDMSTDVCADPQELECITSNKATSSGGLCSEPAGSRPGRVDSLHPVRKQTHAPCHERGPSFGTSVMKSCREAFAALERFEPPPSSSDVRPLFEQPKVNPNEAFLATIARCERILLQQRHFKILICENDHLLMPVFMAPIACC